jgi:hypothetical protein
VLLEEMPKQIEAAGVPKEFAGQFAQGGSSALNNLSGVGDLGSAILAGLPPDVAAQVKPLMPAIVTGIHEAFSIATSATFVLGIGAALLAAALVLIGLPGGRMGEGEVTAGDTSAASVASMPSL